MRKSTTISFLALVFTGLLSAAQAASALPDAAVPAQADSSKPALPAKTVKAKKAKAAAVTTAKDSLQAAVPKAGADTAKAQAAAVAPVKTDSAKAAPVPAPAATAAVPAKDSAKAPVADSNKTAAGTPAVPAVVDTAHSLASDSAKAAAALAAASAPDSSGDADSAQAKKAKKRRRVVRETTVNTIDELKGRYRSPKKALFMSMVVPGLGQAYVGQHWFNYTRGAAYFLADIAMIYGWHHYVVTRQNAQIDKYQKFADSTWSQKKYEDTIAKYDTKLEPRNQERQPYCDAIQEHTTASGNTLYQACQDLQGSSYASFQAVHNDQGLSVDSIGKLRSQFPNPHAFYELIGKDQEFITGWNDANNIYLGDSAFYAMGADGNPLKDEHGLLVLATTVNQQKYIDMRAKANDYARMQAYFLGGMVVNHIVSAIDAALAAHYHNKSLYQTETSWYDRLRLDSRFAWNGFAPVPTVTASFTF